MEFVLHYNTLQDSILTLVGGVLYIISGSATINYYKILVRRGSSTEKMKIQSVPKLRKHLKFGHFSAPKAPRN